MGRDLRYILITEDDDEESMQLKFNDADTVQEIHVSRGNDTLAQLDDRIMTVAQANAQLAVWVQEALQSGDSDMYKGISYLSHIVADIIGAEKDRLRFCVHYG